MSEKLGRDFFRMEQRIEGLVERGVLALEKLASDPVVEIEAGPPICPSCGKHDPIVTMMETEGQGKLSDFIIKGQCHTCGETIYGIIESYSMHASLDSLKNEMEVRRAEYGTADV